MERQEIPIEEGLWSFSPETGRVSLIGSRCCSCDELFFPERKLGICTHCQSRDLERVEFSDRGKICTFTIVYQRPGGGWYKGPVPYAYGVVELPEGIRIMSLLTSKDLDSLDVGMDVSLVVEPLFRDEEGRNVLTYKFKPAHED